MTYKGVAKGKTNELEEALPYCVEQLVSVLVEPLRTDLQPGSPVSVLRVMRELPQLSPEDVDELEQAIERGKLPVRTRGAFSREGAQKRPVTKT